MPRLWSWAAKLSGCLLVLSAAAKGPAEPEKRARQATATDTHREAAAVDGVKDISPSALRHDSHHQRQKQELQQQRGPQGAKPLSAAVTASKSGASPTRSFANHVIPEEQDRLERFADQQQQFRTAQDAEDVGHASWRAWNGAALLTWAIWLTLTLLVYAFAYPERGPPERERWSSFDPKQVMTEGHFQCMQDRKVCFWSCLCPGLRWSDTVSLGGYASFWAAFATFSLLSLLNYMNFYTVAIVVLISAGGFIFQYAKFVEKAAPEHFENKENNDALTWTIVGVSVLLLIAAMCSLGFVLYSLLWSWETSIYMGYFGCFTWGAFTTAAMVVHRQALRNMFGMPHGNFSSIASDWCFVFWCPWCAIAQEARAVQDAYRGSHAAVKDGPAAEVMPAAPDLGLPSYGASSSS